MPHALLLFRYTPSIRDGILATRQEADGQGVTIGDELLWSIGVSLYFPRCIVSSLWSPATSAAPQLTGALASVPSSLAPVQCPVSTLLHITVYTQSDPHHILWSLPVIK